MADRPSLLFLCQTLPYPPDGGAHIRSYHLYRMLAEEFNVTGLFFYRRATRSSEDAVLESLQGLGRLGRAEAFPIPQETSRPRFVWDHLRSTLLRRAYTVFSYESRAFRSRLRDLLRSQEFDLVHMDSLDLSGYAPELAGLPVVCGHHNVESALLARRAGAESSALRRRYLGLQARLTAEEEARFCPGFAANITCSPIDSALLREIAPGSTVTEVPNGVDVEFFQPSGSGDSPVDDGAGRIVFVGGYSWFPNRDGMEWFATDVLPLIRERRPGVEVTWIGRTPPEVERRYREAFGIHATGFVEDVRPYLAGADCVVVPIRVGGGTRLKILDAWAMGRPMVSTSIGCEGLEAVDGENILVRDEAEAFASGVEAVLADRALRSAVGSAGRRTAMERYAWSVIGERVRALYGQVAAGQPPGLAL